MNINAGRMLRRLERLAEIGRRADGIYCLALTAEEDAAHRLAANFMEEAGLAVRVDAAGNLVGRLEGADPAAAAVLTGSHLDTVHGGGGFDGRLGVAAGIEVAQSLREAGLRLRRPLEVCAYRDEEGVRFPGGYSGARHRAGRADPSILDRRDRDGVSVREALIHCGIDPGKAREAALPAGSARAHVELHIEQGGVLEDRGLAVGAVRGICCQLRGCFTVRGQAAHAGTTPPRLRRDALTAAAEIILTVEAEAAKVPDCVATVGSVEVLPGGVNVIPGEARFSLDLRHLDPGRRDLVFERLCGQARKICAARKTSLEIEVNLREDAPLPCSPEIVGLIAEACSEEGLPAFFLPSGAGHDTGAFIPFCPSGLIFVRSRGGLSHNPGEYSSPGDCALGAKMLGRTLVKLAEPIA